MRISCPVISVKAVHVAHKILGVNATRIFVPKQIRVQQLFYIAS